jgi:hypothetical protein
MREGKDAGGLLLITRESAPSALGTVIDLKGARRDNRWERNARAELR